MSSQSSTGQNDQPATHYLYSFRILLSRRDFKWEVTINGRFAYTGEYDPKQVAPIPSATVKMLDSIITNSVRIRLGLGLRLVRLHPTKCLDKPIHVAIVEHQVNIS